VSTRALTWSCLTDGCPIYGQPQRTPAGETPEQAFYAHLDAEHDDYLEHTRGEIRADGAP